MNTPTKSDISAIKPVVPVDLVLDPKAIAAEKHLAADFQSPLQKEEARLAKHYELQALAIVTRRKFFDGKTPEEVEAGLGKQATSAGTLLILGGNRLRQAREAAGISRKNLSAILAPEIYGRHDPHLESYPGLCASDFYQKPIFLRLMANGIDAMYINLGVRLSQEQLEQAKSAARALIAGK